MPNLKLLDRVRDDVRPRGMTRSTEESYTRRIRRYIIFHEKRHPQEWTRRRPAAPRPHSRARSLGATAANPHSATRVASQSPVAGSGAGPSAYSGSRTAASFGARSPRRVFAHPFAEVVESGVGDRDHDQREQCRSDEAADHGARHGSEEAAALTQPDRC